MEQLKRFGVWLWKVLKDFLKSSTFKRFLWNTLNGLLTAFAGYLNGIEKPEDFVVLGLLFAVLNGATKITTNKIKNYGVK